MIHTMKPFAFLVPLFAGLAVYAASPEERAQNYQERVLNQASGVYEHAGDLYVHVRVPCKKAIERSRIKMKAVSSAQQQLYKWVADYVKQFQTNAVETTDGMKLSVKLLACVNPLWRYGDWSYKCKGQEFSGHAGKEFWLGQVFSKKDVVDSIPESYYATMPAESEILAALKNLLPMAAKASKDRLLRDCGIVDVVGDHDVGEGVVTENRSVNERINEYLKTSPRALECGTRMNAICGPKSSEHWEEMPAVVITNTSVVVTLVTNAMEKVESTVHTVKRAQTEAEIAVVGRATGASVNEEITVSVPDEIIETTTLTLVTRRSIRRRKSIVVTRGEAWFEKTFLSGGVEVTAATAQLPSGVVAAKAYFDKTASFEDCEKKLFVALCENPGDVQLWNLYGHCLLKRDDVVGALICFRASIRICPTDSYAPANLAIAYDKLGFRRLSCGLAAYVYGTTDKDWCREKAQGILLQRCK